MKSCLHLLLLSLAFLLPLPARATDVGGVIAVDTTWTTNDSPYVLTNALLVQNTARLQIDPGVAVQFRTNVLFTIRGSLFAEGTATNPITFSAAPALSNRGGLTILGSNYTVGATGIFSHCDFTRLQASPAVLVSSYATLQITDCVFSNMNAVGVRPVNSRVVINRNEIHDTMESLNAVSCNGVIASNYIHTVLGNSDAIDIDLGWTGPGDPSLAVEWNHVRGGAFSNADGIDLGTTRSLIVRYNVMHDFGDKGISVGEDSEATIHDNLIYDCISGIAVKDSSHPLMINNTIARCDIGINSYEKTVGLGGGNGAATNMIIWDCGTAIVNDPLSQIQIGYSIIQGSPLWPGPGNSNADPLFQDPALDDYRLRPGSSAIDAGTNQSWMAAANDLDGRTRVVAATVDCGTYEFAPTALDAGFTATPLTGPAPLTVIFSATVAGPDTNGLVYLWDFDGDTTNDTSGGNLATVTNIYTTYGPHTPRLTVTNTVGESASQQRPDYITVNAPVEIFVSPSGSHEPPFTNWAIAATNVQDAMPYTYGGTLVWVTAGTYRASAELLIDNARLHSVSPPESTILQGGATFRVAHLTHTNALLQGFTVTEGNALNGGGIFLENGLVQNCIITGNTATNEGGGIEARIGTTIANCIITSNRTLSIAGDGGGVNLNNGGTLLDSVVAFNRAGDDAGGVKSLGAGTLRRTLVCDNVANDKGGGIFLDQAGGVAESCVVISNRANYGGGVTCRAGGRFENCTVADNRALVFQGGGLYAQDGGGSSFNTIYFTNTAAAAGQNTFATNGNHTYRFCDTAPLAGGGGGGNISADPLFINLAARDLRLSPSSPCIDTGTNRLQSLLDITNVPRPLDGDAAGAAITDMGAFELFNTAGDTDGDGMPDGWEQDHGFGIFINDGAADADGDGFRNYGEYVAGTNPSNNLEFLEITQIGTAAGMLTASWPTTSNRLYTLYTGPTPAGAWSNLYQVSGNGAAQSYTNTPSTNTPAFWRVGVTLE